MRDVVNRRPWLLGRPAVLALLATVGSALMLAVPSAARAGKLSWLDEVVQEVVREAEAGGKAVRPRRRRREHGALRGTGRLFTREADEGLEVLARRSDDLAGAAAASRPRARPSCRSGSPASCRRDPDSARTFAALAPAEKRLVVEMGETAQRLARRYPGQAEAMIRSLGHRGAVGRPRLRRRRGRGARQGRPREPGRPPQDGPGRLVVLHADRSCRTRRS